MRQDMDDAARLKRMVAVRAAEYVEDGMCVGLGSGTTAEEFVRALAQRCSAGLRIEGVASSGRTERLARDVGLPLVELSSSIDMAVDGADAIERGTLAAIKGRGGALTREKLIASAARRFVLIADDSKLVDSLTEAAARILIPVEVLPFGWRLTLERLACFGTPVLRGHGRAAFVTDNGNYILDLAVEHLDDPEAFGATLKAITGVIEHGLFAGMASRAVIGKGDAIIELTRDA